MLSQSSTRDEVKPLTLALSWFRRLARGAFATYFTLDPRSLGLCRLGLGALLLYDLLRRVPGLSTWYSNQGLVPNHASLLRPGATYMFSFLFAASRAEEAAVMFAICGVVFLVFTVGYRTRLFHALSLACTVSLHSRCIFLENGGDVVLNLLCAWTLFLPMGARFSVDAIRNDLRTRPETTIAELNDRAAPSPGETRPVASLAVLAILLQLSVIYYLNALHKTGWTWRQGMAVHYVLYQERMVTWLGLLAREHIPLWMSRRMTYTTYNIELLAGLLLLNPFFRVWSRRVAVVLLPGLHLGFAALLNLGQFSFNMIGFYPLLLGARDWELLARWLGPSAMVASLSRWFRLQAKGTSVRAYSPSPARLWLRRGLAPVRELAVVVVMVALGSQVLDENQAVPPRFKVAQAKWMQQIIQYPRLYQGWRMFSADVPTGERMMYVDALTVSGRHVDPFNEAGARVAALPVERIPRHMEQDEFFCDYTNRVPDNDTYWQALRAWIFDYPRRTRKAENRIVSFEAKLLEQDNPPPGEREPRNFRTKVMLRGWEGQ
jgi:hypothetical protein